jgi:hypothetical protein
LDSEKEHPEKKLSNKEMACNWLLLKYNNPKVFILSLDLGHRLFKINLFAAKNSFIGAIAKFTNQEANSKGFDQNVSIDSLLSIEK